MTIGIYCLHFNGTDKVYIGQSINIEKRLKQHKYNFSKGLSPLKLQSAFDTFGTPTIEILLESTIGELDSNEEEAIEIYNSVDNGFNSLYSAKELPSSGVGEGSANSIYSNSQVIESFLMLVDTTYYTAIDIYRKTGVSTDIIGKISCGILHTWLKEVFPEEYTILLNKVGTRKNNSATVVSDKLGAIKQGIIYPKVRSPAGIVYQVDNAYRFAKLNGLAGNHFQEVLNGHRKSHKGWKLCQ